MKTRTFTLTKLAKEMSQAILDDPHPLTQETMGLLAIQFMLLALISEIDATSDTKEYE